jgi:hypothetical protein
VETHDAEGEDLAEFGEALGGRQSIGMKRGQIDRALHWNAVNLATELASGSLRPRQACACGVVRVYAGKPRGVLSRSGFQYR